MSKELFGQPYFSRFTARASLLIFMLMTQDISHPQNELMKAIRYERYGSADQALYLDIPKPQPKEDELLIKVQAASVNPLDWRKLRADPAMIRLSDGLFKPKPTVLGADIAGTVQAVGSKVTQFKPGDRVFGEIGHGGFAEYACSSEKNLALIPESVSFENAAALPVAGQTALQGLRDYGQLQAGQDVLINGASGGIGTYAVQIAKVFGAEVTGVCSQRNLELIHALGADHSIDYSSTPVTGTGKRYDLILDAVGNLSVADFRRGLKPQGKAIVAGFSSVPKMLFQIGLLGFVVSKTTKFQISPMLAKVKQKDLEDLASWLKTQQIKSVIDKTYTLAKTPQALSYLEKKHARGKLIIHVAHPQ